MTIAYGFSLALILMMFGACVAWGFSGNALQALYWFAGGVLNVAVLLMAGR